MPPDEYTYYYKGYKICVRPITSAVAPVSTTEPTIWRESEVWVNLQVQDVNGAPLLNKTVKKHLLALEVFIIAIDTAEQVYNAG